MATGFTCAWSKHLNSNLCMCLIPFFKLHLSLKLGKVPLWVPSCVVKFEAWYHTHG